MTKGFASPTNKTAKELTQHRQSVRRKAALSSEGLHEEYTSHPKAQFIMTFLEYKRLRRNQKKFAKWIQENPRSTE